MSVQPGQARGYGEMTGRGSIMGEGRAPAGWYTMPDGTRRWWDGNTWGATEQEAWLAAGPADGAAPVKVPLEATEKGRQALVTVAQESAWSWAWVGILLSPLAIVGIVKNAKARALGRQYGIPVGWGPTWLASGILAVSAVLMLLLLGQSTAAQPAARVTYSTSSSTAGGWSCAEYAADPAATIAKVAAAHKTTTAAAKSRLDSMCG